MSAYYIQPPSANNGNDGFNSSTENRDAGIKKFKGVRIAFVRAILAFVAVVFFSSSVIAPSLAREASIADLEEQGFSTNEDLADYYGPGQAQAFGCSSVVGIGSGGSGMAMMGSAIPNSDVSWRKYTLPEAYNSGTAFTTYYGEGQGHWFFVDDAYGYSDEEDSVTRGEDYGNYDNVRALLEDRRGPGSCFGFLLSVTSPTFVFWLAELPVNLSQALASYAFDANFICGDPDDTGCINLVGLLGGGGEPGDGLIGNLTNSIYLPLSILAVALAGFSVLWVGFVKKKYREALYMALWTAGAFIAGLIMLFNPLLLAQAPQVTMNAMSACVIGAFNGDNCFSPSGGDPDELVETTGNVCRSDGNTSNFNEQMNFIINGLTCNIYESFILNGWSQAQFGRSYDQMSTDNQYIQNLMEEADIDANTYCVNLRSDRSYNEVYVNGNPDNRRMESTTHRECNVAAYHMALYSETEHGANSQPQYVEGSPQTRNHDLRWFNLAVLTAHDEEMFDKWSGAGMGRAGMAFFTLITAGLGTLVIFMVSIFALVYYLSAVILIAFAPLFLLFGMHPGRGKKIFLGWLEKLVSNVLKYIASALFLIVTLALYGAVLGAADGIGTAFIFVLILTMALLMYRKELIELIGKANMGGEELKSAALDRWKKKLDIEDPNSSIRRGGSAIAGGYVGGSLYGAKKSNEVRRDAKSQSKELVEEKKKELMAQNENLSEKDAQRQAEEATKSERTKISEAAQKERAGYSKAGFKGAQGGIAREVMREDGILGRTAANAAREGSRAKQEFSQKNNQNLATETQQYKENAQGDSEEAQRSAAQVPNDAERVADIIDTDGVDGVEVNRYTNSRNESAEGTNSQIQSDLSPLAEQDAQIRQAALLGASAGLEPDEAEVLKMQVEIEGLDSQLAGIDSERAGLVAEKEYAEENGADPRYIASLKESIASLDAKAKPLEDQKQSLYVEIGNKNVPAEIAHDNLQSFNDAYGVEAEARGLATTPTITGEDNNGNEIIGDRVISRDQRGALYGASSRIESNIADNKEDVDAARARIEGHIEKASQAALANTASREYQKQVLNYKQENDGATPPEHVRESFKVQAREKGVEARDAERQKLEAQYANVLQDSVSDLSRSAPKLEIAPAVNPQLDSTISANESKISDTLNAGSFKADVLDTEKFQQLNNIASEDANLKREAFKKVATGMNNEQASHLKSTLEMQDLAAKKEDLSRQSQAKGLTAGERESLKSEANAVDGKISELDQARSSVDVDKADQLEALKKFNATYEQAATDKGYNVEKDMDSMSHEAFGRVDKHESYGGRRTIVSNQQAQELSKVTADLDHRSSDKSLDAPREEMRSALAQKAQSDTEKAVTKRMLDEARKAQGLSENEVLAPEKFQEIKKAAQTQGVAARDKVMSKGGVPEKAKELGDQRFTNAIQDGVRYDSNGPDSSNGNSGNPDNNGGGSGGNNNGPSGNNGGSGNGSGGGSLPKPKPNKPTPSSSPSVTPEPSTAPTPKPEQRRPSVPNPQGPTVQDEPTRTSVPNPSSTVPNSTPSSSPSVTPETTTARPTLPETPKPKTRKSVRQNQQRPTIPGGSSSTAPETSTPDTGKPSAPSAETIVPRPPTNSPAPRTGNRRPGNRNSEKPLRRNRGLPRTDNRE